MTACATSLKPGPTGSTGHGGSTSYVEEAPTDPAVRRIIDEEESDEEAPLPVGRPHHCIFDGDTLVGYVAPTTGAMGFWSVYNTMRERVALVAPDGKRYKIMFIGSNPDDSLDYMVAKSLKGAFALTFDLESLPRLDPPLNAAGRT